MRPIENFASEKTQNKIFRYFFLIIAVTTFIGAITHGRVDLLIESLLAYGLSSVFKQITHE